MLELAVSELLRIVRDPDATNDPIGAAIQSFFDAAKQATPEAVGKAMAQLAPAIQLEDAERGMTVAVVCGVLVENGFDASPIAGPLMDRVRTLLEGSARLHDATMAQIPPEVRDGDEGISGELFEGTRSAVGASMPAEAEAWAQLEQFWPPVISMCSHSPVLRAAGKPLVDLAWRIEERHEGGHWLRLMLAVLDDEPFLAIEPSTNLGIAGRISGIVENFQLHVLLMDAFPQRGLLRRRRVPQNVVDIALGNGPQGSEGTVTGAWNLYTWRALQPNLELPDPGEYASHANWVWGEGVPADIPPFDGQRVVLLGPPSYERSWGSQRMFADLKAALQVTHTLDKREVRNALQQIAHAAAAEHGQTQ